MTSAMRLLCICGNKGGAGGRRTILKACGPVLQPCLDGLGIVARVQRYPGLADFAKHAF